MGASSAAAGSSSAGLPVLTGHDNDDWFRFTVPAHTRVTASLTVTPTGAGLSLTLYDATTHANIDSATGNTLSVVAPAKPVDVDVFLQVRNRRGNSASYSLTITQDAAPVPANDLCTTAVSVANGQTINGTLLGASNDFAFVSRTCTAHRTTGEDVFYSVTVDVNQTLTATLTSAEDMALYLVSSCADYCCWAGKDATSTASTPEVLTYQNVTAAPQTLILGVDARSALAGGGGDLSFTLAVAVTP